MSGGVDSSVTAGLLLNDGFEVFGVTMALGPKAADAVPAARRVAEQLGIAHHVIDCRDVFRREVLRTCWDEYDRGRTPNPCVLCNQRVKFGFLLDEARRRGATLLATGHHARVSHTNADGLVALLRGQDQNKDQAYFLAQLRPDQLAHVRFPVGHMTKDEVRQWARDQGLVCAETKESQDTCISTDPDLGREGAFAETLRREFDAPCRPGEVVDTTGQVRGRHQGIHRFTVGQRRGLGIAFGHRAYVQRIDGTEDRVVVAAHQSELLARGLTAGRLNWLIPLGRASEGEPFDCTIQIRYRHRAVPGLVRLSGCRAEVTLTQPVAAVTPGQVAVFFDGAQVLGSGWIEHAHFVEP
jgi:tRNA-specific 2-thiouridylase